MRVLTGPLRLSVQEREIKGSARINLAADAAHRRGDAINRCRAPQKDDLHGRSLNCNDHRRHRTLDRVLESRIVLHRGPKVKERRKAIVQRELHANGLRLEQKHVTTNPSAFPQPRIREPPGFSDGPIVYSREPDSGQMVSLRRDVCMTSKSTRKLKISGAHRIPAAFFAIAVLTGCAPNFGNLGPCAVCSGPPTQANLEGTLSGLVGSGL